MAGCPLNELLQDLMHHGTCDLKHAEQLLPCLLSPCLLSFSLLLNCSDCELIASLTAIPLTWLLSDCHLPAA
jgi:hypothetical protein